MIDLQATHSLRLKGIYSLRQLGTDERVPLAIRSLHISGKRWMLEELAEVVILRTKYLYDIIPCQESLNAITHMTHARAMLNVVGNRHIKTIVEGHVYQVVDSVGLPVSEPITFIRRSGKAITYDTEWPGLQTQEVLRAMIDQLMLDTYTEKAADLCRQALWEYEARAYRRKRQELNRDKPDHDYTTFPYDWDRIEEQGIGKDGHIQYLESEVLYYANFGACDADLIPGVSPFAVEIDPVYIRALGNLVSSVSD